MKAGTCTLAVAVMVTVISGCQEEHRVPPYSPPDTDVTTTMTTRAPTAKPPRAVADDPADPRQAVITAQENVENYWGTVEKIPDVSLLGAQLIKCDDETFSTETMLFCPSSDDTMYYVAPRVSRVLAEPNGQLAIELAVAHEFGHAIQAFHHRLQETTERHAAELSADCLAGMYAKSLGKSQAEITAAWDVAPVGHEADRMQAFAAGQHTPLSARNKCITSYGD